MNKNRRTADPEDSTKYLEGTGSIGGWEKCAMRQALSDEVLPLIPEVVAGSICPVTKSQTYYDASASYLDGQTTTDMLWIPSSEEMQKTYKYAFQEKADRGKCLVGNASKNHWWLRSACSYGTNGVYFDYIEENGGISECYYNGEGAAYYSLGVPLCFCLGKAKETT